jgi:hypothetical protein
LPPPDCSAGSYRQRLVHTFATNLRGPAEPLTFASAPVRAAIPTPATTGNVIVTFGVLSYAGTLRITVLSDPSRVPDVAVLTAALRRDWAARPADRRGLGSAAPASVEAEHACAAHAHIVPLCTAAANSAFSHPGIPNGGSACVIPISVRHSGSYPPVNAGVVRSGSVGFEPEGTEIVAWSQPHVRIESGG